MPRGRPANFQVPKCVVCDRPSRLANRRYLRTCGSDECREVAIRRRSKRAAEVNSEKFRKYGTQAERALSHRRRLKLDVLRHYSFGDLKCACCGDGNIEFLTIDHIDGGGAKHRRELGKGNISHGAGSFYSWLANSGYPDGYRVLCQNCNFSMGVFGYCPHALANDESKTLPELFVERSTKKFIERREAEQAIVSNDQPESNWPQVQADTQEK